MNEKLKQKLEELRRNKWVRAAYDNRELITAVTLMVAGTIIVTKSLKNSNELARGVQKTLEFDNAPQSFYSYMGSPLQFILRDDIAEGFNRASDAFMEAQVHHKEKHGDKWSPNVPLLIRWDRKDKENYDAVGRIIKLLVEINGGPLNVTEEMLSSDHLEKISRPFIN